MERIARRLSGELGPGGGSPWLVKREEEEEV
jgi:hypothetical protein